MITVWRIVHKKFAADAYSGKGAGKHGARWNGPGSPVAYASESLSLATLEKLVYGVLFTALNQTVIVPARIPNSLIEKIDETKLPRNWRDSPAPIKLRSIGDKWIKDNRYAALRVPSAVIPIEYNYLINPHHADYSKIISGPAQSYILDKRLKPKSSKKKP